MGEGKTQPKHANSKHVHSLVRGAAVLQKSKTKSNTSTAGKNIY